MHKHTAIVFGTNLKASHRKKVTANESQQQTNHNYLLDDSGKITTFVIVIWKIGNSGELPFSLLLWMAVLTTAFLIIYYSILVQIMV